ncbi:MAG TPA: hypothetical protein PKH97_07035, partial [Tetrasphaera sp.]|uniref:hypothetical protein n=1 Tax=Nostocoides sp. TaxID=1917966 RepID=UPI002C508D99
MGDGRLLIEHATQAGRTPAGAGEGTSGFGQRGAYSFVWSDRPRSRRCITGSLRRVALTSTDINL